MKTENRNFPLKNLLKEIFSIKTRAHTACYPVLFGKLYATQVMLIAGIIRSKKDVLSKLIMDKIMF